MSSPQPFCGFWHKGQILFSEPFSTSVSGILNNVQVLQISPCAHQSSLNIQPKWHTLSLYSLSLHPNPRHNQLPRRGPVFPYNVSPIICFPAVFPRHSCKLEHNSKNVWSKRDRLIVCIVIFLALSTVFWKQWLYYKHMSDLPLCIHLSWSHNTSRLALFCYSLLPRHNQKRNLLLRK